MRDTSMASRPTPQSASALTRAAGRLLLRLAGFHLEGEYPAEHVRYVMIVAPHTSNWDFLVGLFAKWALGLRVRFLAKHTLFKFPLGVFLRWWGGIPIRRHAAVGVVPDAVEAFRRSESLALVITPEGTRRKSEAWKSGFYRIAQEAGVPIVPVVFDYPRRAVRFHPPFWPTGDYEQDLPRLQALYSSAMAFRPENY
jgi:1-acyl-sn-glycerol-3-phosphate acyltransferase